MRLYRRFSALRAWLAKLNLQGVTAGPTGRADVSGSPGRCDVHDGLDSEARAHGRRRGPRSQAAGSIALESVTGGVDLALVLSCFQRSLDSKPCPPLAGPRAGGCPVGPAGLAAGGLGRRGKAERVARGWRAEPR